MSEAQPTCAVAGATCRRLAVCALVLAVCAATAAIAHDTKHDTGHDIARAPETGPSGLPLPRFVSLKSDRVNLRNGPGVDYPATWVFRRAGLPLEVVKEYDSWRQVRDADGTTGWMLGTMLSGRRTALVLPWELKRRQGPTVSATLHDDGSERSPAVVDVEAGVLASIIACDGRWCRIAVEGYRGYIEQAKLWGAYQGEVIK